MACRFAQQKQLLDEPDEKSDDVNSGHDHEGENKKVEGKIYHAEGHIYGAKF